MFGAWQRARSSKGKHSWVRELYGREPEIWNSLCARITLELMIEQTRQERMGHAAAQGKQMVEDLDLKMDPESGWIYMQTGEIGVRF